MQWSEIRHCYPSKWLIIKALEAHTVADRRQLARIAVLETCADSAAALQRYRELHRKYPTREI